MSFGKYSTSIFLSSIFLSLSLCLFVGFLLLSVRVFVCLFFFLSFHLKFGRVKKFNLLPSCFTELSFIENSKNEIKLSKAKQNKIKLQKVSKKFPFHWSTKVTFQAQCLNLTEKSKSIKFVLKLFSFMENTEYHKKM